MYKMTKIVNFLKKKKTIPWLLTQTRENGSKL